MVQARKNPKGKSRRRGSRSTPAGKMKTQEQNRGTEEAR